MTGHRAFEKRRGRNRTGGTEHSMKKSFNASADLAPCNQKNTRE